MNNNNEPRLGSRFWIGALTAWPATRSGRAVGAVWRPNLPLGTPAPLGGITQQTTGQPIVANNSTWSHNALTMYGCIAAHGERQNFSLISYLRQDTPSEVHH